MWGNFSGKRSDTGRNRKSQSGHWSLGWWLGVRGGFFSMPCRHGVRVQLAKGSSHPTPVIPVIISVLTVPFSLESSKLIL